MPILRRPSSASSYGPRTGLANDFQDTLDAPLALAEAELCSRHRQTGAKNSTPELAMLRSIATVFALMWVISFVALAQDRG